MSTEYDLIYVQEAIELAEDAWEALTTRLRNGKMPYQQLLADTNPDRPTHWLKLRCDAGQTLLLESRHEDNPTLWDEGARSWTPEGAAYLEKLDRLTGPRKQRLRFGRWVQAEGIVYEGWDAAIHVIDRFNIPRDWLRYWVVDFGFRNPLVVQWWAADHDGRLYLYREYYRTGVLVEDAAREIKALSEGEPEPVAVICDHDAEDRETFRRHARFRTVPAHKELSPGIQAVARRLKRDSTGRPGLMVLRDSLVRRDPDLVEAKKPTCFVEEVDGYVWNLDPAGRRGEEPVKQDDHGCDCVRYLVSFFEVKPLRKLHIYA
jgi:phage terminase large subunit